jgi:hypothetical protein
VRENSVVPPGLESFLPLFPALKRWAKLGRPSEAAFSCAWFHRKDDGKREIGVVAEDVDKIVPEMVSRDPKTHEIQGVDYSRLAALLIGAVKAQQAEIRQLKAQIEQLTASQSGQ